MRRGFRAELTITITFIVLLTILAIGILANVFINKEFEKHAKLSQQSRSEDIVNHLSHQYNIATGEWDVSYVHGVGMYALSDGYIIKLYNRDGALVWDAENHDMTLCAQIMEDISARMQAKRPTSVGGFAAHEYELMQGGQLVGFVAISYYGPYFLSESDFHFLRALNIIFLVIGLLSFCGSMVAGGILARRISRPIVKTVQIATQIAEGNYGIRFRGAARTRELEELVAAVNHMAESLDRQETLRRRLTTDVAHELRTPLTAIASYLEAILEGVWEPSEERLRSCYEEVGRLAGLVSDLEKLSQVENENILLTKTPVDLLEAAHAVGGNFASECAKRSITLQISGQSAVVQADQCRLTQVITNLLSNAVKYTEEFGHIHIAVEDALDYGAVIVTDDGMGIPDKDLPFIFERFYRADKSRSRKTGSSGIGLAIVKSIVEAHEGTVTAKSEEGRGSSLRVALPKK